MHKVADAKVAIDRMQTFLNGEVSKFEDPEKQTTCARPLTRQLNLDVCLAFPFDIYNSKKKEVVKLTKYVVRDEFKTPNSTDTRSNFCMFPSHPFTEQLFISDTRKPYLLICNASCSWNQDYGAKTLNNFNINVGCNDNILAITGAVGSGKSSLLTAILGELSLCAGHISFYGKVAYVPQIPWVFSGTIRENILFSLPFNQEKFLNVVHVCGLTKDLAVFSNGDMTKIGQRGVTLSGGQKARVGLARAVYSDADIYLLDDPLSAVDTKVGRRLFESCILRHLSGCIRLLVTHQLQYLKDVDRVIVMDNGSITHQGVYAEILEQGAFKGVAGLPEDCEDGPESPGSVSLEGINDKCAIKRELQPLIDTCDMPEGAQRQTLERTLAELVQGDKRISDTLQHVSIVSSCSVTGLAGSNENAAFKEDNEAFESNLLEKENVGQELSELLKSGNEKEMIKVLNKQSVSFVGAPSQGQDNEAFVDDLTTPKQKNEGIGVNVNNETIAQTASSLILSNMRDVLEAHDKEPSIIDLKEEEEDKSAGTVTFRLYWNYLKQGLPVSKIILLAVSLLFAQGKVNS